MNWTLLVTCDAAATLVILTSFDVRSSISVFHDLQVPAGGRTPERKKDVEYFTLNSSNMQTSQETKLPQTHWLKSISDATV